jgi:hypothetical protein
MLQIVNLDPEVTRTHTKDYAETVIHVQSSLAIKGTSRRKAESPGAQLDANGHKTRRFEPAIQSGRFDGYHGIAQVDYPHECGWQAVHTGENPSRSENSMYFGE